MLVDTSPPRLYTTELTPMPEAFVTLPGPITANQPWLFTEADSLELEFILARERLENISVELANCEPDPADSWLANRLQDLEDWREEMRGEQGLYSEWAWVGWRESERQKQFAWRGWLNHLAQISEPQNGSRQEVPEREAEGRDLAVALAYQRVPKWRRAAHALRRLRALAAS